jgi:hypothetical protein
MQGFTDRERSLAVEAGGPGAGFTIALAEVSMYFDNHQKGRPHVADAVLNIKVGGDSEEEKIAGVAAIARWLGVEKDFRNGTHFAQRRWGVSGESITVEASYAPDPDRTALDRLATKEAREAYALERRDALLRAVREGREVAAA